MGLKIALAGNPNCGKTTLFNELTGSTQYVGNWPGVTVEKKEGRLKGNKDVIIQDLPGIYSLSPYTLEEVVSRDYLVNEKPDVILNIVDGSNIERNLYLTTQLLEVGLPTVVAINMMDIVEKNGDKIDVERLSKELGCKVVTMSALKGQGVFDAAKICIEEAKKDIKECPHVFSGSVEHALAHIEESIQNEVKKNNIRWFAIKIFERDKDAYKNIKISDEEFSHMEDHIKDCEKEMDDDAESIITNQRYEYIQNLVSKTVFKNKSDDGLTQSDKIDRILTNRFFALPIFAVIMFLVYFIAMGPIGTFLTDWTNDVLFGEIVPTAVEGFLDSMYVAEWVQSLVVDGIIGGVGTVLGFVPQIAILFILLSILEDSGYMARVAFIFDRIFRRFGLSGKSFIPMVVGTGCGVPAIMATRTIEEEKDRRMTIILATFIPCAAKMEIVLIMTRTFFGDNPVIATSMYFIGIAIVVVFGIILKKMKYFSGDPAPFVMELPAYHFPSIKGLFIHVWERVKGFMVKAGTIIFTACIILWLLMNFNFNFELVDVTESILKSIGEALAPIFAPLGFGTWQGAVASVSAEIAKEQATATLSLLAGAAEEAEDLMKEQAIFNLFGGNKLAGLSFMLFNIFNAPCLVAIATAFREQAQIKWGLFTFIFQMLVGYMIAMCTYNIGMFIANGVFSITTLVAFLIVALVLFLLFRPSAVKKA